MYSYRFRCGGTAQGMGYTYTNLRYTRFQQKVLYSISSVCVEIKEFHCSNFELVIESWSPLKHTKKYLDVLGNLPHFEDVLFSFLLFQYKVLCTYPWSGKVSIILVLAFFVNENDSIRLLRFL